MKEILEEYIGQGLRMRGLVQKAHWRTSVYAQHIALGELYDALDDKLDLLVEQSQDDVLLTIPTYTVSDSKEFVARDISLFCQQSKIVYDECGKTKRYDMQNTIADISTACYHALYKLKHLS